MKSMIDNHGRAPLDIEVRIEVAADFADLFEVKEKRPKKGTLYRQVSADLLTPLHMPRAPARDVGHQQRAGRDSRGRPDLCGPP